MSEGHIPLDHARIFVREQGRGAAAVFVHGFGGDLETWDAVVAHLPAGRRLICYDLRGFGQSVAASDGPFRHADDLLALLDALEVDRCDLVGLSMGGAVALNFALDHPDRLHSLALVSPAITAWEWSDEWRALWRGMTDAARAGDMDLARARWLSHPLFDPVRGTPGEDALAAEVARFSGTQWIADHQAPALPDLERLHELAVPTLLLSGGRDLEDFRIIAAIIAESAPGVVREERPDLGHMIPLEDPHWCAGRLAAFWA